MWGVWMLLDMSGSAVHVVVVVRRHMQVVLPMATAGKPWHCGASRRQCLMVVRDGHAPSQVGNRQGSRTLVLFLPAVM
jgi:hypothetical protein